jgi:SAM-dependent methyltransferase
LFIREDGRAKKGMGEQSEKSYWEATLGKYPGLHGVGYVRLGEKYNRWLYRVRRAVFMRRVGPLKADFRGLDILDVGSGTGFYIDRWRELGAEKISALDFASAATEVLERKYPECRVFRLDIGEDVEEIGPRAFDVVSAFDVLFHIVDDGKYERAIQNIFSLLRPGGLFVFSDNFVHGDTVRKAHIVHRSLAAVEGAVEDAGFRVVERFPMFVLMNHPVDSRSGILKILWMAAAGAASLCGLLGFVVGAFLYPLELLCVSFLKESPTTEIMVCEKPE